MRNTEQLASGELSLNHYDAEINKAGKPSAPIEVWQYVILYRIELLQQRQTAALEEISKTLRSVRRHMGAKK